MLPAEAPNLDATMPRAHLPAFLLGAILVAAPASAHEVVHEVRRDKAIAVRATHHDGDPLAQVAYEVYAPSEPKRPRQTGRTDRAGWLAFVPDAPGKWKVKVIEAGGHGFVIEVDAEPTPTATATPTATPTSTSTSTSTPTPTLTLSPPLPSGERAGERGTAPPTSGSGGSSLRPLLGLAAIGAVFAALYFGYRKKGPTP